MHSAPTYALKPASTSKTRPIQGGLGCTLRPILPVCGSGPRFYPGCSHWTFYCPCGHTSVLCPSLINHAPVQSSSSWGSASFPQTSRNPTPKLWPKAGSLLLASCVLSLPSPQPPASPYCPCCRPNHVDRLPSSVPSRFPKPDVLTHLPQPCPAWAAGHPPISCSPGSSQGPPTRSWVWLGVRTCPAAARALLC